LMNLHRMKNSEVRGFIYKTKSRGWVAWLPWEAKYVNIPSGHGPFDEWHAAWWLLKMQNNIVIMSDNTNEGNIIVR
jgi:hypothetical protein